MNRKFIAMADLHIRSSAPEMRKDDYIQEQWRKLNRVIRYANFHKYPLIFVAGDVFDTAKTPYATLNMTADIMKKFFGHWVFIYGQHDLIFHNYELRAGTPLATLCKLPNFHIAYPDKPLIFDGLVIYGASWGVPLPENIQCDILLVHKLITRSASNMDGAVTARKFLTDMRMKAGVVISGDNHKTFRYNNLINPGSMMRMSTNQIKYEPGFFCVKYDKHQAEKIKFHIKEDVWKEPEQTDEFRTSFIRQLRKANLETPDFIGNIAKARDRIKDRRIKDELDTIIKKLEEI